MWFSMSLSSVARMDPSNSLGVSNPSRQQLPPLMRNYSNAVHVVVLSETATLPVLPVVQNLRMMMMIQSRLLHVALHLVAHVAHQEADPDPPAEVHVDHLAEAPLVVRRVHLEGVPQVVRKDLHEAALQVGEGAHLALRGLPEAVRLVERLRLALRGHPEVDLQVVRRGHPGVDLLVAQRGLLVRSEGALLVKERKVHLVQSVRVHLGEC